MRSVLSAVLLSGMITLVCAEARGTMIDTIDPVTAKAGDVVTANGSDIGSDKVAELYLTAGGTDLKVEIVEQSDKAIKFKVPAAIKPGRWALMMNLKSNLMELPVKLTVE